MALFAEVPGGWETVRTAGLLPPPGFGEARLRAVGGPEVRETRVTV